MTLLEKLDKLMNECGITKRQLSINSGIPYSTIDGLYKKGYQNIKLPTLQSLASYFNVSLDYLGDDDIVEQLIHNSYPGLIPIEIKKVPLLGTMACGEPVYKEEDFESYVAVGSGIHADAAIHAEGDSMVGARILDGDIVFIHYQPTVENGEIAAVWVDDGFTLKRIFQLGNSIILHAENPGFKDMIFRESDGKNIKIVGKAVAFQSDVK